MFTLPFCFVSENNIVDLHFHLCLPQHVNMNLANGLLDQRTIVWGARIALYHSSCHS